MNIYIDSENVSPKSFSKLLENYSEKSELEILIIKIFCDFGDDNSNSWYKLCKKYINDVKVEPIQCMKKPKMGSIDNMIQAEVFDDVLCDCKNMNKKLTHLVIFSNDFDYNPLIKRITKHGYNIVQQKDIFCKSDVIEKSKRSVIHHPEEVKSDVKKKRKKSLIQEEQSNETPLEMYINEIKRIKKRVNKLKDKFEKSKITLQDYFSAINQLLKECIKKTIKSSDLIEIEMLKDKLKDEIITTKN